MRLQILVVFFILFLASSALTAQGFSGGFRAGLNFVTLSSDLEDCSQCADGNSYEFFNRTTGFHVGATFAYAFTDLVGVKANFMYNQKGGEKRFNGPSYFYLYDSADDVEGTQFFVDEFEAEIDVVNSYIEIPVMAYYRLGIFEVEGGASFGFMVNSRASGGLVYRNTPLAGGRDLVFNLDGSFNRDEAGFNGILAREENSLPGVDPLPEIISAYYNSNSDEALYRRLDLGLVAGVSAYLNNGLFIGVRYQYGLTDVTNGENDLRLTNESRTPGREFNTEDKDYYRTIQASIGFRF